MELNKQDRMELRKRVEEKLKDIEFNPEKRIKLSKKRLDELLFDYKRDEKGNKYKVIGFYSNNLCKLDLSKVSCKDLSFNTDEYVDLDDTNMPIDFSLTYEYNKDEKLIVRRTSFKNVNLSNNDLKKLTSNETGLFKNCNLSNTKIKISGAEYIDFDHCNLSDNCFLSLRCDIAVVYDINEKAEFKLIEYDESVTFKECNMRDTRIGINVDEVMNFDEKLCFRNMLKIGYLDGCYLNGHKVLTVEEKISNAIDLEARYKKYKANRINETLDLIDSQLSSDGGRLVPVKKKTTKEVKKKTLKSEKPKFLNGIEAYINEDIDE